MTTIFTIGHSRHPTERLVALLKAHFIQTLVDVRRKPWSRLNPHFNRERLGPALKAEGIGYLHLEDLGGLREDDGGAPSPDAGWRNPFLRSYAGYARTPAFAVALERLMAEAGRATSAVMCAEGDWRQCHRQIVTDYLLDRGTDVRHILPDGTLDPAALTPFATPQPDGTLLYPEPPRAQLTLGLG
jgi:uncharacterized protein (DUF488 family)